MNPSFSVLVTGVGGQGVLTISKCIASAAFASHTFVSRTESRGLSQRGGSVWSVIRFGEETLSPYVGSSSVDLLLGLDALESARNLSSVRLDGVVVTNKNSMPPAHLHREWVGRQTAPEDKMTFDQDISFVLQNGKRVYGIELDGLAAELDSERSMNFLMLGAASLFLTVALDTWSESISNIVGPSAYCKCIAAFELGRRDVYDRHLHIEHKVPEVQVGNLEPVLSNASSADGRALENAQFKSLPKSA